MRPIADHIRMILRNLLGSCLVFAVYAATPAIASTSANPRLIAIEKLIEGSSASRTVDAAKLEGACTRRAKARALLEEARQLARDGGDPQRVDYLLDEATKEMLGAVRMVKQDDSARPTHQKEYVALTASLDALLDAYIRIRSEDGDTAAQDDLQRTIEERASKARALYAQGDLEAGLEMLGEAYAATKTAIEHLRGGETLVRTLHFETEADEYAYEVDRNDSLRMLVDMLLKERIANDDRMAARVTTLVAKAETLRLDGESLAQDQQYVEAIATLEASTIELVRAIRNAGIYIPQ